MLGTPYRKEAVSFMLFLEWLNIFKEGHDDLEE
jgi:hypothetical protein